MCLKLPIPVVITPIVVFSNTFSFPLAILIIKNISEWVVSKLLFKNCSADEAHLDDKSCFGIIF